MTEAQFLPIEFMSEAVFFPIILFLCLIITYGIIATSWVFFTAVVEQYREFRDE